MPSNSERNELLMQHLKKMNVYDLERLRTCFEDEYRYDKENRDNIEDILDYIDKLINYKKNNM